MSTLVLQLGQGGNQYGFAFFNVMAQAGMPCEFFEEKAKGVSTARAFLIDMEPKVVAGVVKKANATGTWNYGPHRFTLDSGSGNNWAAGYCSNGVAFHEPLLQQVRLKVEACDCFGGFLGIQSLAGGTGAGFGNLGAYMLEVLKDEYPSASIFSHCIWPYQTGEVVVQNYNVLLTLAKLQEVADGIITVENEALAAVCKKSMGISKPSFTDMNHIGAYSLASVLLPSIWRPIQPIPSQQVDQLPTLLNMRLLSDLAYSLCAHPAYRMMSLYSTPQVAAKSLEFTTFNWTSQLKQLKRMVYPVELAQVPGETALKKKAAQKSVASLLVLRGPASRTTDVNLFTDPSLYASWCIDPLNVAAHESSCGISELVAAMVTNSQSAITPATKALSRAYAMYFSKAYLHQYYQHGLESGFFEAAFATVEDVLLRYSSL